MTVSIYVYINYLYSSLVDNRAKTITRAVSKSRPKELKVAKCSQVSLPLVVALFRGKAYLAHWK